jgi:hypothetical protein
MNTIWIIPIEPIDQRYTKQWYDNIPVVLENAIQERELDYQVVTVDGEDFAPEQRTEGAFLDFGATNVYKATQTAEVSKLFSNGKVKPGDKFLVTDAWNFIITPIRYMSDLLDIPVEIHGIWHAGAYDPTDILGYKMRADWPHHVERSWFHACDYNYYATDFHKNMFLRNLSIPQGNHEKAIRSGQPHELIVNNLRTLAGMPKERRIMWPHRYNADKQPEIAENLAEKYNMVITQNMNLSKEEYYQTLAGSVAIFSCALHENLGISVMEAVLTGAIPIVPDRASYSEMYLDVFKYPSEWTEDYNTFLKHRDELTAFIDEKIDNAEKYISIVSEQQQILIDNYLNSTVMIDNILK